MLSARELRDSWSTAEPVPFWLDRADRPVPRPTLDAPVSTDLAVVGGGFSGLWTALLSKERDPGRQVVLIEADRIASAATGRNGGFCEASLTHGEANGQAHFPDELGVLDRLARENLDEIEATIRRYGIGCDFERPGTLSVATQPYQVKDLAEEGGEVLSQQQVRAEVDSPTYLAGVWHRDDAALLDPAKLAWGLGSAAESVGVRIAEHTAVTRIDRSGRCLRLLTRHGPAVTARQVTLGTSAFPSLVRRMRWHIVPVYDYVLVTEPLTPQQLAAVGWRNRQGVEDLASQFHYYRLTADNRILWGGYDAIYYFGRKIKPSTISAPPRSSASPGTSSQPFPSLKASASATGGAGLSTRARGFAPSTAPPSPGVPPTRPGTPGQGVGTARFGANVMLDLLAGEPTERTELSIVRRKPLPFPPEPLAYLGIQLTRWSIDRADHNHGKRNAWLRTLDRLGVGFGS
jgi:glycine/D-amino acid oxidase-like deaminating enzyme